MFRTKVTELHYWSRKVTIRLFIISGMTERMHSLPQTLKNLIDYHTSEIKIISNNILSKHGNYSLY